MMKNQFFLSSISEDEMLNVNGGFAATMLAIGGVAAACVAIYEAGKYTGEVISELLK